MAEIREKIDKAVAVAFDAGNLLPVAEQICKKVDPKSIIIAGDNDSWKTAEGKKNTGSILAKKAAEATDSRLAIPKFKNPDGKAATDFNDLFCLEGP